MLADALISPYLSYNWRCNLVNSTQIKQLDELMQTANEILAGSTASLYSPMLEGVRASIVQIQKQVGVATQGNLVQSMTQEFEKYEKQILAVLEMPLRCLRNLTNNGSLSNQQKAKLLIQLGKTHDILAQWDVALDDFYKALDYCEENSSEKAETLKFLGHIKSKQRDYSSAESLYQNSISIYSALQNHEEIANIHTSLGFNAFERCQYERAQEYCHKALKIASSHGLPLSIARANGALATLASVKGEFPKAIEYYQACLETYANLQDERGLAEIYHNMAMLQVDMGQWKQAGESYQRSLEYAQKASDLELIGLIYLNRTELAIKMSDYTAAKACCKHAVKTFAKIGSQTRLGEAYKFYGRIYQRYEDWEKSEMFFKRSIQVNTEYEDPFSAAEAQHGYGLMLMEKGDNKAAESQLRNALKTFEQLGVSNDVRKVKDDLDKLSRREKESGKVRRIRRISRE